MATHTRRRSLRFCIGLTVSFAVSGCSGELVEMKAPGESEPSSPSADSPAGVDKGATLPGEVFIDGHAVAGCDHSVADRYGDTPLRRLTNLELDNTMRDTFGLSSTVSLSATLPRDGEAGPFPSNAKGSITEMYLNRYQDAAARIGEAVGDEVATMLSCASNGDAKCARTFIRDFARKAYRREPTDAQVEDLMAVYEAGATDSTFNEGIGFVVEAMLMSPTFMYHLEAKPPRGSGPAPVPAGELAERLSYFLWGSIPDAALFEAARDGRLDSKDGLRAEAERMLADSRAEEALNHFTGYWLGVDTLAALQLPSDKYESFTPAYGAALLHETQKFVNYVLRDGRSDGLYETLLTSRQSFPEGSGFAAYGMKPPAGYDGSEPIDVPGERAGLITQPALLSAHSSEATSPIKRGVFVLNGLLCAELVLPMSFDIPPPPPFMAGRSIREGLEEITEQPQCAPCHKMINPIGFALEGYDRMGRERKVDEFGEQVDSRGNLTIGDPSVDGPIEGGVALAHRIYKSDSGRNCMIQQVVRYALGREEEPADTCSFAALAKSFEASTFNVHALLLDLVTQNIFRFHPGA